MNTKIPMTTSDRRKTGGGKLSRSETVSVRLDPKLRYLAELAAKRQRRALSSYIEWAIENSLASVHLDLNGNATIADEAEALWDVDEADRFAKLALRHQDLLTHEEQILWKLVRENGLLWHGRYVGFDQEFTWDVEEQSLIFERLREHWSLFQKVASGELGAKELPTWVRTKPKQAPTTTTTKNGFEDMDDDIPF